MTDYGHELRFGTFLTPDAGDPARLLELASLTEVAGLDLVSVQDHPYQPRFLDALAVLGTILARTSSLRVAPNVATLPLRPPYVLAKTVASLDRLHHGRMELGIGAGAFWDAIEAAGGQRRTPGEAVAALADGIGVIREVWQQTVPAHDVEIWVGAIGPRMMALTGRLGDGWLPSMSYVPPDDLAERNDRIDTAAGESGRAPVEIRRLYNVNRSPGAGRPGLVGGPEDWAEQLAGLTLEHGMSTFFLATDDPTEIRRFGDEVAPRVRELVEAGRTGAAPVAPPGRVLPWVDADRPTYDAGERSQAWNDQERATAQHLVDVHDHLRSELRQLFALIDQVEAGSIGAGRARSLINTMTMRQNNWTLGAYCESYCRVVTTHHTIEDTSMFPHLRASEPGLGPVIDRLEEEHHAIAAVLDGVDRALVALVSEPDAVGGLRRAVDLLEDTMASHLAWEESVLLEPLARHGFA